MRIFHGSTPHTNNLLVVESCAIYELFSLNFIGFRLLLHCKMNKTKNVTDKINWMRLICSFWARGSYIFVCLNAEYFSGFYFAKRMKKSSKNNKKLRKIKFRYKVWIECVILAASLVFFTFFIYSCFFWLLKFTFLVSAWYR